LDKILSSNFKRFLILVEKVLLFSLYLPDNLKFQPLEKIKSIAFGNLAFSVTFLAFYLSQNLFNNKRALKNLL
jgi:hypothetical protein